MNIFDIFHAFDLLDDHEDDNINVLFEKMFPNYKATGLPLTANHIRRELQDPESITYKQFETSCFFLECIELFKKTMIENRLREELMEYDDDSEDSFLFIKDKDGILVEDEEEEARLLLAAQRQAHLIFQQLLQSYYQNQQQFNQVIEQYTKLMKPVYDKQIKAIDHAQHTAENILQDTINDAIESGDIVTAQALREDQRNIQDQNEYLDDLFTQYRDYLRKQPPAMAAVGQLAEKQAELIYKQAKADTIINFDFHGDQRKVKQLKDDLSTVKKQLNESFLKIQAEHKDEAAQAEPLLNEARRLFQGMLHKQDQIDQRLGGKFNVNKTVENYQPFTSLSLTPKTSIFDALKEAPKVQIDQTFNVHQLKR